jgi:Domain of unknown function (DUF4129)
VRLDPPLDPTSPEARDWLEEELRKPVYREPEGLLERLWDWLGRLLSGSEGTGGLPGWTIWLAAALGLAVVALVVLRSLRAERRMTVTGAGPVHEGPARSAAEHRASAAAALASGDPDTAVLEGYRALARSAVERTLLDDLPGRTAHEVAVALAPVFPTNAARLASAADTFDAVRYGRRAAAEDAARAVVALDKDLAATRPLLPEAGVPARGRPR